MEGNRRGGHKQSGFLASPPVTSWVVMESIVCSLNEDLFSAGHESSTRLDNGLRALGHNQCGSCPRGASPPAPTGGVTL